MKPKNILKLRASGKINLYLNVAKDGRADGYHEIKSIMQSISLSDELTIEILKRKNNHGPENKNGIYITYSYYEDLIKFFYNFRIRKRNHSRHYFCN